MRTCSGAASSASSRCRTRRGCSPDTTIARAGAAVWESAVARQRTENKHLTETGSEEAFVRMREARDRELPMPKLILPSLQ